MLLYHWGTKLGPEDLGSDYHDLLSLGFCFRFGFVVFVTLWTVLVIRRHIDSTLLHYISGLPT